MITAINGNSLTMDIAAGSNASPCNILVKNGSIKKLVTGTAPNRIYEIEYRNVTRGFVEDEILNFKIKLFETSNKIQFVYGFCLPGSGTYDPQVGLKGSTPTDFNTRYVHGTNTWSASVASPSLNFLCQLTPTNYPNNGLHYEWFPNCQTPTLNVVQSTTMLCAGESSTITASGADTYTWSNGNTNSLVVVSPFVTTTYTLTGASGSCTSMAFITQSVTSCTGIGENNDEITEWSIFPSPFSTSLRFEHSNKGAVTVFVLDITGRKMIEETISAGIKAEINTTALPEGIYILKVSDGINQSARKLIKN